MARLSILLLFVASLSTSASALTTCVAAAIVPPLDGASTSEVVGDIVLVCGNSGGQGLDPDVQNQTIGIQLNTDIVNPESGGVTDAVLIVNENYCNSPAATGGTYGSCSAPDVRFQDPQLGVKTAANRVGWSASDS